jgi:hypothetical protein
MPVWGILVRRWYLVLGALIVSAALAIAGFYVSKPTYEARADILLLPPARTSGPTGGLGNPYLALGGSLGDAAQVVAAKVASDQSAEQLAQLGARAVYSVGLDPSFSAPVVVIVTRDTSADEATRTLNAVISMYNGTLLAVQQDAGAPARALLTTRVITATPIPQRLLKTPIRNAIAGGVGGLLLGLLPILLLERLAAARTKRGQARPNATEPPDEPERDEATPPSEPTAIEQRPRRRLLGRRVRVDAGDGVSRRKSERSERTDRSDAGYDGDDDARAEADRDDTPVSLLLADPRDP